MNIIGTRETFDGTRYTLVESADGLSICDGRGTVPTRANLSAAAWLALWGDLAILIADEIPAACKRLATAARKGADLRGAIHAPAVKAESDRAAAASRASFVRAVRNGVIITGGAQ